MKLTAVNNYIVTEITEREDQETNGIFLPDAQKTKVRWHKVTSIGLGSMDFQGSLIPLEVKVDDMVYIQNHGQFEIEGVYFKGEDCMVASINDVMAYFRDGEFQPLGSLIEIEKIEMDEQEDNGIFMTKTFKYPSNVGIVKKVGLGWSTPSGNKIPFQVKEGDLIVYNPFAERTLNMEPIGEGKRYLISHGDVFGVVNK